MGRVWTKKGNEWTEQGLGQQQGGGKGKEVVVSACEGLLIEESLFVVQ